MKNLIGILLRYSTLDVLAVLYLFLPFLIFVVGFLRWYIAIIVLVFSLFCLKQVLRTQERVVLKISCAWHNWFLLSVSLLICWHCGIGEYWVQHSDFWVKNPLLIDLANRSWPLTYSYQGESVGFAYYLFPYLVPSLIGKCCIMLLRPMALLWASFGLFLVLRYFYTILYIDRYKNGIFILVFAFVCFSGLEVLGGCILRLIEGQQLFGGSGRLALAQEDWCAPYFSLYASNLTSMIVCYNQCIGTWLITLLIIHNLKGHNLGFYYSLVLLYSPWAAIGLLPIVFFVVLYRQIQSQWSQIQSELSYQNIIFPVFLLLIVGSFYMSSSGADSESGWFYEFVTIPYFVRHYILFVLFEVLFYFLFIKKYWKGNPLLQSALFVLMFLPIYKMTLVNDLLMRASIPALMVICFYWIRFVMEAQERKIYLVILICISGLTPMEWALSQDYHYLIGTEKMNQTIFSSFSYLEYLDHKRFGYYQETSEKQFFVYDPEKAFFWKYLAK